MAEAKAERWAPWISMLMSLATLLILVAWLYTQSTKVNAALVKAEEAARSSNEARVRWEIETRNAGRDLAVMKQRLDDFREELNNARKPPDPDAP